MSDLPNPPQDLKVGNLYRNIRTNNLYEIIGFANHSETTEVLVLYKRVPLGESVDQRLWARPVHLFRIKFKYSAYNTNGVEHE
jgi:hypothetical protein